MSGTPKLSDVIPAGPERDRLIAQFGPDGDVAALAKSFNETKALMSSTARVPAKDATAEAWGEFWGKMGRPANPESYVLPPDLPAGIKATMEGVRHAAFNKGLSQEQFATLVEEASAITKRGEQTASQRRSEWERKTRESLGEQADEKLSKAKSMLEQLLASDPDAKSAIESAGLDKQQAILTLLLKANNIMSDDKAPFAASPAQPPGPSPQQLRIKAIELRQSKEFNDPRHPLRDVKHVEFMSILDQLARQGFEGLSDPRLVPALDLSFLQRGGT